MNHSHNNDEQHNAYAVSLNGISDDVKQMRKLDARFFLRKRYLLYFLLCIGMTFLYLMRTNLSIAIVEMTADKNIILNNETFTQKAEFDWDTKTKGFILSSFSVGYLMGPVGGMLAVKYGGVTIYGLGVVITALLTILSPFLLRLNFLIFISARILEGVFESFSIASTADIFAHWSPPNERSRMMFFCLGGISVGLTLNYPLSGFLAYRYGWEAVFFVTGGIVFIWYGAWLVCISNDPTMDPFMTQKERDYFKTFISSRSQEKTIIYPWKNIFTSKSFWVYINEYFTHCWSDSFLAYCLPLYIKDMYNINVKDVGIISGIPNLSALVSSCISAFLFDYLRSRGTFSKSFLHRVFIAIGQISIMIGFAYIGLRVNVVESIIVLAMAKMLVSFAVTSYNVFVIDVFMEYAGIIRGFAVTASSLAHFLNPILMGCIVGDHSRSSWNLYFLLLSIFSLWSLIIFCLYGSAELEEWAAPKKAEVDEKIPSDKILN